MRRKKNQISFTKLLFLAPFYIGYLAVKIPIDILASIPIPNGKPIQKQKFTACSGNEKTGKVTVHYVKTEKALTSWNREKIRSDIRKSENSINHLELQLDYLIKEYRLATTSKKRFQIDKQIATIENRLETENSRIRQAKLKLKA